MQRQVLLPSTPPSATHARERTRRLRTLAAAGAALLTVLLLLAVESWQHSAPQSRANISTGRDVLGQPADAAVVEAASNGERATGWWGLWQNRIADQEARVSAWRERQRSIVYEETTREEAVAAGSSAGGMAGQAEGIDAQLANDSVAAHQGGARRQQLATIRLAASAEAHH